MSDDGPVGRNIGVAAGVVSLVSTTITLFAGPIREALSIGTPLLAAAAAVACAILIVAICIVAKRQNTAASLALALLVVFVCAAAFVAQLDPVAQLVGYPMEDPFDFPSERPVENPY